MRIGLNYTPPHDSPEAWAQKVVAMGARAACFPVNYAAEQKLIDQYVEAAKAYDVMIAEVGMEFPLSSGRAYRPAGLGEAGASDGTGRVRAGQLLRERIRFCRAGLVGVLPGEFFTPAL